MTPEERDKLRTLAEKATPGPWQAGTESGTADGVWADAPTGYDREEGVQSYLVAWCHGDWDVEANAAFIAAANPTAILALLDEVDRLRAD